MIHRLRRFAQILIYVIGCFICGSVFAQPPIVGLDAGPVFLGESITFKDQVDFKASRTVGEFTAWTAIRGKGRFVYTLTTGLGADAEVIPMGALEVGEVTFGKDSQGQSQQNKPVKFDLTHAATHRLQLAVFPWRTPIYPVAEACYFDVRVTGRGEGSDGKQAEGFQRHSRLLGGIGAEVVFARPWFTASVLAVGSSPYKRIEANLWFPLARNAAIGAGYEWKKANWQDIKLESNAGFVKARYEF